MSTANLSSSGMAGDFVRRRMPITLWLGLFAMVLCELLLAVDVHRSGRSAVHSQQEVMNVGTSGADAIGRLARFVAVNMTPLVWPGYVLFL